MKLEFTVDEYGKDILRDTSNIHQVMMEWEKPYMEECINFIAPSGDVLEIGFGMGYSASKIIENPCVTSYTVIECAPVVWDKVEQFKLDNPQATINLIKGRWQDVLQELGVFDIIFFDDYDPDNNTSRFREFLVQVLKHHTKIGSRIGVYAGNVVNNLKFDCIRQSDRKFPVTIPKNCKYASGDHMYLISYHKHTEWKDHIYKPGIFGAIVGVQGFAASVPANTSTQIIVVDNLYSNPKDTLALVNNSHFSEYNYTEPIWDPTILQPVFEKYIGMPIKSFSDSSGIWFKNDTYEAPIIMESGYEWVAVLMYGMNEAHGSGIQFFEAGIGIKCENIHGHHKTDFIKSKFNRIVFFKGNSRHMIVDNVGNTIRNCGLTQRFYFN